MSRHRRCWSARLRSAGAKTGEDVIAVGRIEVAECVADDARARCPAPAAKHLLLPEGWRRVLGVRIQDEPGIRTERVGGPFPDISHHLTTSEGAIPRWERPHVDAAHVERGEVGPFRTGKLTAPGKVALAIRAVATVRRPLPAGCQLPLGFRGQSTPGPRAVGIGLVPVDMRHRLEGLDGGQCIEPSPAPMVAIALPIDRMLRLRPRAPLPTFIAP